MFTIKIYETPSGNRPFEKYIEKLSNNHKNDEVAEILMYLHKLEEFGFSINEKFKAMAIKPIRDGIYELRPSSNRIFFFYYQDGDFIILHGWEKKRNTTDNKEIKKAINEKNTFLKGRKNERIN